MQDDKLSYNIQSKSLANTIFIGISGLERSSEVD